MNEHSFYIWRKQLRLAGSTASTETGVRFALVETTERKSGQRRAEPQHRPQLELVLAGGERLYIPADEVTLQLVLNVLQKQRGSDGAGRP